MIASLLISILLSVIFFIAPVFIGIALFFMLVKGIRDTVSNKHKDY